MTSYKFKPYLSLIGFFLFILTLFVNFAFSLAKEPGSKMVLSVFSAILLVFTLLWGLMGIIEFISLIKKTYRIKNAYENDQIDSEEYRRGKNSLNICFLINIGYLVIVTFQLFYVISNWDKLNV